MTSKISFNSRRTLDSTSLPGVTFTIYRMTEGRRNRLRVALSEPLAQLREIQSELDAIELPRNAEGEIEEGAVIDPATMSNVLNLSDKIKVLQTTQINPEYCRVGLHKIEGLDINGEVNISADLLREDGPEELYNEIVEAIKAEASMTAEERRNLESPTTSDAAEVGGEKSTSVQPA